MKRLPAIVLMQPLDLEQVALGVLKTWVKRDRVERKRDFTVDFAAEPLHMHRQGWRWTVVLYESDGKIFGKGVAPRLDTAVREAIGGAREYNRHRW